MLDIGERLSSYEPLWENWYKDSYIGGGNFGRVYRFKQDFFGETRYSAVKVIPIMLDQERNFNEEGKAEFIAKKKDSIVQEIKNMYKLKGQSNLVQCLAHSIKDIFDADGKIIGFDVLIQMDLYTSLPQYIRDRGELSVTEVEKLAVNIAVGLRSMHDINMLHRDIKTDNIYVDSEGNFLLGDFGISKQEAMSSYSTLAGTQPFIAPEVWKVQHTNRRYTKTADIYSYGISLYYLLNGNMLPMVTENSTQNDIDNAVFDRLNGKQFNPPKNGSDRLKSIVMKCCAYRPEDRFQSMAEVLNALSDQTYTVPVMAAAAPQPSQQDPYATMYAGNDMMTNTGSYNGYQQPPQQQYYSAPNNRNTEYDRYGTPYSYPSQYPANNYSKVDSSPAAVSKSDVNNKIIIGLCVVVVVLFLAMMAIVFSFALKGDDSGNGNGNENPQTVILSSSPENNAADVVEDSSEEETTVVTTAVPETTTTTKETTTTTKATTAKKPSKISTLKKPDKLYAGIEEGDIYSYEGTGYTLYYGPDETKYAKTSIYISSYDIIQEHGRLKDASWLYVSIYGSNECGWIKNNSLSELTEYPGMNDLTGYLSPGYFGTINKDSSFRRGPNQIRDTIPNCGTIYKGAFVEVVGSCPGWYYIYYNSYYGWVSSSNVEINGER